MVSITEKMETEVVIRNDRPKSFDCHARVKFDHCGSKIHTGGSARASRCVLSAVNAIQTTGARNTAEMTPKVRKLAHFPRRRCRFTRLLGCNSHRTSDRASFMQEPFASSSDRFPRSGRPA